MSDCNLTVIVDHNYTAKEKDEITIIKGEILSNVQCLSGGWWEGVKSSGKKGMFPENFVHISNQEIDGVMLRKKDSVLNRTCRALFSYEQKKEDELTLAVGDIIEVLGEAEEGWWQGKLNGKSGVFPSNFVNIFETNNKLDKPDEPNTEKTSIEYPSERKFMGIDNIPTLPPKPQKEYCRVEFSYTPQNDDELELCVGDIVTIVSRQAQDIGWWKGEINGKVGVFPDNFVKVVANKEIPQNVNTANAKKEMLSPNVNEQFDKHIPHEKTRSPKDHQLLVDEKLDSKPEEKRIPPPSLPKKPITSSKISVAGNLITKIKQNVKNVDQKIIYISQDTSDGITSSKSYSIENVNALHEFQNIRKDSEFDNVERNTMLSDMRANRAKAPKRRPPTTNNNNLNNENNNYINGNLEKNTSLGIIEYDLGNENPSSRLIEDIPKVNKSVGKHDAPWMAELKANQEKKKSSEPTTSSKTISTPNEKIDLMKAEENKNWFSNTIVNRKSNIIQTDKLADINKIDSLEKRVQILENLVTKLQEELHMLKISSDMKNGTNILKVESEKYV